MNPANIRYLPDLDVHALDCAGHLSLELGLSRLRALEVALAERPARNGLRKLLIDFRKTTFESDEVHRALSVATRSTLGLTTENSAVRVAFVHSARGVVSDKEAWFLTEAEALDWLAGSRMKPPPARS
jgi:hypothetical protein